MMVHSHDYSIGHYTQKMVQTHVMIAPAALALTSADSSLSNLMSSWTESQSTALFFPSRGTLWNTQHNCLSLFLCHTKQTRHTEWAFCFLPKLRLKFTAHNAHDFSILGAVVVVHQTKVATVEIQANLLCLPPHISFTDSYSNPHGEAKMKPGGWHAAVWMVEDCAYTWNTVAHAKSHLASNWV